MEFREELKRSSVLLGVGLLAIGIITSIGLILLGLIGIAAYSYLI